MLSLLRLTRSARASALRPRWTVAVLFMAGLAVSADAQVSVTTTRASVASNGAQATGASWYCSISSSGRYIAFESSAANLVAGDTNGQSDVFVRDRELGTTRRVSVSSLGVQGNGWSYECCISPDGQYVAFLSNATNLVTGDTNAKYDVFVHHLETGITTRASVSSSGVQGNGDSYDRPAISEDARFVAFRSFASNLVAGDTNGDYDVFVRDMAAGTTTRVSVATDGTQGTTTSDPPSISSDGRYIAFVAQGALTPGDTNGANDVFVRDQLTGTTTRASLSSSGTQGNRHAAAPSISANGRYVAFSSASTNLVTGDTNGLSDVFVRDLSGSTTTRVSVSSSGAEGLRAAYRPSVSSDGRYIAFESDATNMVDGDTNGVPDIFVRDMVGSTTIRVSVSSSGVQGIGYSNWASISGDGRWVAYHSESNNLVAGDTNNARDVFLSGWAVLPRVAGRLVLLDYVGPMPGQATFEFRDTGSGSIVKLVDAAIGQDGSFEIDSPAPGLWDLSTKVGHWLRRTVRIDCTGGDVVGLELPLVNGDIDGDDAVTVFDYNVLSEAFDSVPGDPSWVESADLDGDEAVTVFDYNILSANFDLTGD